MGYLTAVPDLRLQFAIMPALALPPMSSKRVWQVLDYALQWLGAGVERRRLSAPCK